MMKTRNLLAAAALVLNATGLAAQTIPVAARNTGPNAKLPSLFIEELTWTEIRDALGAGVNVVIVPTGGTEKNGFHMIMGKHNVHSKAGAKLMAERLGNALIAPVIKYVPEGQATEQTPGVLSCRDACFENQLLAVGRSMKVHGFTDVLFIGDNGGNQNGLRAAAEKLNAEFAGSNTKVYALTDFYEKGHEYLEAYLMAAYGWTLAQIGSHAGIQDTSQMMYVNPSGIRFDQLIRSEVEREAASVSGDPTKSTAEFGRMGINFKANGAIAQYMRMKTPPRNTNGS
jgi:creatinine amidohydrolase/Fe(II)-dependent formamide hydrolase-like protein